MKYVGIVLAALALLAATVPSQANCITRCNNQGTCITDCNSAGDIGGTQ